MTDRFYALGLPAEADAWKTTYEVQNEMRAFARSAYPPGTAVHLPGVRDHFGYSNPGPLAHRLAKPELHPKEEVDVSNPREHHAVPHVQIPDDRVTFHNLDMDEMMKSYQSPVAKATLSGTARSNASRSRSLPSLTIQRAPPRFSEPPEQVHRLEDDHFSYFVPKSMQRDGQDKLNTHLLSKLSKSNRISFPFTGDGTGFRTQSGLTEWFPRGTYKDQPTTYRTNFGKPPYYRLSPLNNA